MICNDTMSHINVGYTNGYGWWAEAKDIYGTSYSLDVDRDGLHVEFSIKHPDDHDWKVIEGVEYWAKNVCGHFIVDRVISLDTISKLARAMANADRVRSAVCGQIKKQTVATLSVLSVGECLQCR